MVFIPLLSFLRKPAYYYFPTPNALSEKKKDPTTTLFGNEKAYSSHFGFSAATPGAQDNGPSDTESDELFLHQGTKHTSSG